MAETRSRISQWGSGGKMFTPSTSQPVSTAGVYTINQFKEDFRKTRVPVHGVQKPDSVPPNMVADSIEIMIPVPEGSLPPHLVPGQLVPGQTIPGQPMPGQLIPGQPMPSQQMPGQPQVMPVGSQVYPTPVQMMPRPAVSVSQVPIGNVSVHGVPLMATVQQPFPLSQAPQLSVPSYPHHGQMPAVSYVQSSMPPFSVSSTIGQQVPMRPAVHPAISAGMAMQQQGLCRDPQQDYPCLSVHPGSPKCRTGHLLWGTLGPCLVVQSHRMFHRFQSVIPLEQFPKHLFRESQSRSLTLPPQPSFSPSQSCIIPLHLKHLLQNLIIQ
uniref:RNA-binding protein 12-like n=1 Tax=Crassostrea virginica TaxID=6565 RepID=A0A8B8CFU4_CRAVI|nr:RNA-binding protein 12-like [Crassostrea virginica]